MSKLAVSLALTEIAQRHPGVDAPQWAGPAQGWSPADRVALVRAIEAQLTAEFGDAAQPWEAGSQAAFLLAALFHDRYPDQKAAARLILRGPATVQEGWEVEIRRSQLHRLPPIPLVNDVNASAVGPSLHSRLVASVALLPAPPTSTEEHDATRLALLQAWQGEGDDPDRAAFMAAAAAMVLQQACWTSGVVTGGALFRELQNPQNPEAPASDVRLAWRRTGPLAEAALTQAEDGGAYLLL